MLNNSLTREHALSATQRNARHLRITGLPNWGRLSDHKMSQRTRDSLDGMKIFAIKEKQVKGRQSDQRYRHDAEHDGVPIKLPLGSVNEPQRFLRHLPG